MAADVVDEQGRPVRGQVGELVIRAPWIGMTRGFWNDPERYLETYWSRFPDVWVHGDWAAIDEDGCGTSSAAPTTRSRSPASGSVPRRSNRCSSSTPR